MGIGIGYGLGMVGGIPTYGQLGYQVGQLSDEIIEALQGNLDEDRMAYIERRINKVQCIMLSCIATKDEVESAVDSYTDQLDSLARRIAKLEQQMKTAQRTV